LSNGDEQGLRTRATAQRTAVIRRGPADVDLLPALKGELSMMNETP
jgi:hypothetical protein